MKKKIIIATILIILCVIGYNYTGWEKIYIGNNEFYDDCTINIDLDNDGKTENIEIKKSGKYIIINGKKHVINERIYEFKSNEKTFYDYDINQYHIIDLNNDNMMEIIHRTFSNLVSPECSYYTIYNFYDNELYKVGETSFVGNIPDNIYVKNNTIKFEYWPYESSEDYREEKKINLQLKVKLKE